MNTIDVLLEVGKTLAVGTFGALGLRAYDTRAKRADTKAAEVSATSAADATGRHRVREVEITTAAALAAQLMNRIEVLEKARDADRISCAKELDELRTRVDAADERAMRAEARTEALSVELAELRRASTT